MWYLSFATEDRFLGGLFIKAMSFPEAVSVSHVIGANPGGEVQGAGMRDDGLIPSGFVGRLLSKKDLLELDILMDGAFNGDDSDRVVRW